jgi:hypothetical protein
LAVTSKNFRFGFEFECSAPQRIESTDLIKGLPLEFKVSHDGSVRPGRNHNGYELISLPVLLNPLTIAQARESIITLLKRGCRTNKTCGFHVHFSSYSLDYENICWVMMVLAGREDLLDRFIKFGKYEFEHNIYATRSLIQSIRKMCNRESCDISDVANCISSDKNQVLRLHPQGTIEWRGPREFMNRRNFKIIDTFFRQLYHIAGLLDQITQVENVQIGNHTFTRENLRGYLQKNPNHKRDNIRHYDGTPGRFNQDQDRTVLKEVFRRAPWLAKAKFTDARIGIDKTDGIIWKYGRWLSGTWFGGTWEGGSFSNSEWLDGDFKNGQFRQSIWHKGNWRSGYFEESEFRSGHWFYGTWDGGVWGEDAIWHTGRNATISSNWEETKFSPLQHIERIRANLTEEPSNVNYHYGDDTD